MMTLVELKKLASDNSIVIPATVRTPKQYTEYLIEQGVLEDEPAAVATTSKKVWTIDELNPPSVLKMQAFALVQSGNFTLDCIIGEPRKSKQGTGDLFQGYNDAATGKVSNVCHIGIIEILKPYILKDGIFADSFKVTFVKGKIDGEVIVGKF